MTKLIRSLAKAHSQDPTHQPVLGPDGQPLPDQTPIDPSKLEFCRVLYDYDPQTTNGAIVEGVDLTVKKGDLVAVLSKSDPMGNASDWWRCRARDGRMGYLPGVYMESIQRKQPKEIEEGRAMTMSDGNGSRTSSLKVEAGKVPVVQGKAGDISVESFQKSQFYS